MHLIAILPTTKGYEDRTKLIISLGKELDSVTLISNEYPNYKINNSNNFSIITPPKKIGALNFFIFIYKVLKNTLNQINFEEKIIIHDFFFSRGAILQKLFFPQKYNVLKVISFFSTDYYELKNHTWRNSSKSFWARVREEYYYQKMFRKRIIMHQISCYFSEVIIGNSQQVVDDIHQIIKKKDQKFVVIPNNIDEVNGRNIDGREEILSYLKLPSDKIIILYVGRLVYKRKGLNTLLDGCDKLLTMKKDIVLCLAGPEDPISRKEIISHISRLKNKKSVYVLKHLSREDIFKLYQVSDILNNPSLSEGFPRVVIEGMRYGVFPVLSDIPQHKNIDLKNRYIKLFKRGDHIDMAKTIEEVIHNNLYADKTKIIDFTINNYSTGVLKQKYLDIYNY